MPDVHDAETRRRNMRAIKAENTRPEMIVRKICHSLGYRYRLHRKDLPGKPDLVFPKYQSVIFVNGCFWHKHDCYLFKLPETRRDFWLDKLSANAVRDEHKREALIDSHWSVLLIWECALKGPKRIPVTKLTSIIDCWLSNPNRRNESIEAGGVSTL
jgi:DNA mismatch endonuclease (patch repair protein)